MQGTREHVVRRTAVTLLAALLLVLTGTSGAGATTVTGHRVASARTTATQVGVDTGPVVVPHVHRAPAPSRSDGTTPALLPDRVGSPRPSYTGTRRGETPRLLHDRTRGSTRDRAPPA